MASFKVVISDPKTRKAYSKEVDQVPSGALGKHVGESIPGGPLGLDGYTLEITGGSDKEGFPMRRDVEGSARKRILLSHPPGFHPPRKGMRKRKSIRGNTVSQSIVQVNLKVAEWGSKSIEELLGAKAAGKGEETAEGKNEGPAAEKKAEAPKEAAEKKEAAKEEKPGVKEKPSEEAPREKPGESAEKAEKKMGVKKLED